MKYLFFLTIILLVSCNTPPPIADQTLRDRFVVCSLGYDSEIMAKVEADIDEAERSGTISANFKQSFSSGIREYFAESDRLDGYNAFVSCMFPDGGSQVVVSGTYSQAGTVRASESSTISCGDRLRLSETNGHYYGCDTGIRNNQCAVQAYFDGPNQDEKNLRGLFNSSQSIMSSHPNPTIEVRCTLGQENI